MLEGRLIAEFSSFYEAVDKASVKFRSFEEDGAKVERRLNSIADGFSGRKVVQEASLVSEAIERIGGVSKLSTNEAASGLKTLEAAMAKMLKTGQEIPTSMMKTAAELRNVTRVTDEADKTVARITQNYQKFDGILQSLGVNIAPYVKGLEDVARIAGEGEKGIGLFGKAVAAVPVAMAAWKFGREVGEVTGLTDAIAEGWATLLGWGNAAEQEALAVADAFDLMGKAEANIKRNAEAAEAHAKAVAEDSAALKENWRITEGNKDSMARLAEQLEATKKKRKEDEIAAFQASQAQSIFGDETEAATAALVRQTSALDDRATSLLAIADAAAEAKAAQDAFMNAPTLNDRDNGSQSFDVGPLVGNALDDVVSKFRRAGDKSPDQALQRALEYLQGREGRYAPKDNASFRQMQNEQYLLAQLRMMLDGRSAFTGGGDLVNVPTGGTMTTAWGGGGAGGNNVTNVFHVNGTGEEVARKVSDIIMRDLQSNRQYGR